MVEFGVAVRTENGQIDFVPVSSLGGGGGGGTPPVQNLNAPNSTDTLSTQGLVNEIAARIAAELAASPHVNVAADTNTPNTTDAASTQAVVDAIATALSSVVHNPIVQDLNSPNATDTASTQAVANAITAALAGVVHNPIVQNLNSPNATDTASTQAVANAIATALAGVVHNPIVQNLNSPNATDTASTQAVADAIAAALLTIVHNPIVQDLTSPNATDTLSTQGVQNAINQSNVGQYAGFGTDESRLPLAPNASATATYIAYALLDRIGTGTIEAPEFPAGWYANNGSGWVYQFTPTPNQSLKTRYTADGTIADTDHLAILDGVTSMTIVGATANREIEIYNAGNAPVTIVDTGGAQFSVTDPNNQAQSIVTTDSTLIINHSHKDGKLVFDGTNWEFSS